MSNIVRITIEAASPGRERQSTSRPSEEIVRYACRRFNSPPYKASTTKGQARGAAFCFCTSLLSNLECQKKVL